MIVGTMKNVLVDLVSVGKIKSWNTPEPLSNNIIGTVDLSSHVGLRNTGDVSS